MDTPKDRDDALDAFLNSFKNDLVTTKPKHICDNLAKAQRRSLRSLRNLEHTQDDDEDVTERERQKVIVLTRNT